MKKEVMIIKINVHFKHFHPTEGFKEMIELKSKNLEKYFHDSMHIQWTIFSEKLLIVVHGHITGKNTDIFSEAKNEQAKIAFDDVLHKLQTQLKKNKAIKTKKHGSEVA
jgi:ribosomal subunit interface protein